MVIPARNEAVGVGATVDALADQRDGSGHPLDRRRYEVILLANNCSDDTAGAARRLGAEVLVRADPARRGKGYALELGVELGQALNEVSVRLPHAPGPL